MSLVEFSLATAADDADLRRILRDNPMPGSVSVTFEREPCYLAGSAIEGPFHQTMIGRIATGQASMRQAPTSQAVGMGSRAVRDLYVNGTPQPMGYMSLLRVDPHFTWGSALPGVLRAGWRFYQQLHADGRVPYYLVSLVQGNAMAARLMLRELPDWPVLRPLGAMATYGIQVGQARRVPALARGLILRQGTQAYLPEIAACLARNGARAQLTPVWTADALADPEQTPGLRAEDFCVVTQGGKVIGCMARWNQRRYKQTVVRGYARRLRWLRPALNGAARLGLAPSLPPVGAEVRHAFASHLAVDDDNPAVFDALLAAVNNSAAQAGDDYLMLGLAAAHPLASVAQRYRHIVYPSSLYLATWNEPGRNSMAAMAQVDARRLGAEVAVL